MHAEYSIPTPTDVGAFYDRVNSLLTEYFGGSMHFGYWHTAEDTSSFTVASERFTDIMIGKLAPARPRRILDAGCGTGAPAVQLARATGAQVVGVSISAKDVELATELAHRAGVQDRVTFQQADMMDLPFEDDAFDAAWAFESLGHVPDHGRALNEIGRVIQPGSRFALTDSYALGPIGDDIRQDWLGVVGAWRAAPTITVPEYEELLHKANLELDELTDVSDNIVPTLPRLFDSMRASRDEGKLPAEFEELAAAYRQIATHESPDINGGYLVISAHHK